MAMTQKERDARRSAKAAARQEEMLRLPVLPATKQALAELMTWANVEQMAEAMTLMIHRVHELGPAQAVHFLTPPLHEITISPAVARKLKLAYQREALRICRDE